MDKGFDKAVHEITEPKVELTEMSKQLINEHLGPLKDEIVEKFKKIDDKFKESTENIFDGLNDFQESFKGIVDSIQDEIIKFKTIEATQYSTLIDMNTISQTFKADQDIYQELVKVDNTIREVLVEKSNYVKRLKEVEVEIKIVESHAVMSEEFATLKNAPQRDAFRRIASEAERRERAKLEGEIEECINALYKLKNDREGMLSGLTGIRAKLNLITSIFTYIGVR